MLSTRDCGEGPAVSKVQGRLGKRREQTTAKRRCRVEPRSEGNEAERGVEKSEPLNSTEEAGELTPGDPVEGSRRSVQRTSGGKDGTDQGP